MNAINPYEPPEQLGSMPASQGIKHIALTSIIYSGPLAVILFFACGALFVYGLKSEPTPLAIVLGCGCLLAVIWWTISVLVSVAYLFWRNSRTIGGKGIVANVGTVLLMLLVDVCI